MEGEVAGVHFGCPSELSGVSEECGFMIMGELMGLSRNIRTLLGDSFLRVSSWRHVSEL